MDIVEFVERILDLKLLDFQKKYLTKMHDIYKNDPDSFNKFTYLCRRGSTEFDIIPLLTVMFRLFDKFSLFNGEVKKNDKDNNDILL